MATPTGRAGTDLEPGAIAAWRAHSQRLWGERFATPMEAFAHLGAVQSQEYQPSKLTPAMRTVPDAEGLAYAGPAAVDALIDQGAVVRTHVLRPTWHTVPVGDLRMMLAASADRVQQLVGNNGRGFGLDAATLERGAETLAAATSGGRHLLREEAAEVLAGAGVPDPSGQRLGHLLGYAELESVICSGAPKDGKQTYANFDERVPAGPIAKDEAIRALALRFFTSRGPATLKDFTRWATLKVADAKLALDGLGLGEIRVGDRTLYYGIERPETGDSVPVVDFVQGFDEMLCSYTDSKDWVLHHSVPRTRFPDRPRFNSAILLDGQVIGNWKATPKRDVLVIETWRARGFTAAEIAALRRGADRLRAWFDKPEMELVLDQPE
ncbi:winged helix DNA-binding domain-containing protein [Glycomyces sp. TRM65418]|uniref:winged helix DNA-binding domain-containing protein n=1 Tax=Glycomyces sp. TRM65418 TaxID=2867006 RepID=UPI001CE51203|nr:winged helix DNA-binding domain-containing protein [Glycomyces sp. TRM65418]MCC3763880.1 winged helix DNA-binding domain-containing protein [Glycomyces sp. TRM65418]QZD53583.1 winged helix DNA-binding domain-containing protein [Glycomyces sp. TRM65418]